jgi:flavodoxin/16S rRNA G966 N2-methylase RsmD
MMQISPETQLFIREHSSDDVRVLALQAKKYPDIDMPTAITQIAGRKVAAEKIPSWWEIEKIWYPKHLSLEQCSSEITARYKARLLQGDSLTDLTGGFGIDCSFLATGFKSATYVERQEELCEIAAHNFPVLNLNHINIKNEDGVTYLQAMSPVDCLFLDPARRNEHGGKTVAISDCEPNVAELEELLLQKANRVMIKLSPMLDLSLALKELKQTQEVHILSVNNECKELLILLGQTSPAEISIHCVNLFTKGTQKEQHFVFTREQEQCSECTYTDSLETYLYEPNASRFLLIVSATTGQGDIPPNLQPFASALADRAPYMKGWRYALIAMGDSSYEHFCGAGRRLDELLQELAAVPLIPRLEIDATVVDEPEVAALAWLKTWENRL